MTLSRKIREQMLALCGSIQEEDGTDPRRLHNERRSDSNNDRYRQQRLCQQVARTLAMVIPQSSSSAVRGLRVAEVTPGQASSSLQVKLVVETALTSDERQLLLEMLEQQQGWLRAEVAAAITRKRVPQFSFELVGPTSDGGKQHEPS